MKASISIPHSHPLTAKIIALGSCLLGILAMHPLKGQQSPPAETTPNTTEATVSITPSRFVSPEMMTAHIQSTTAKLAMQSRTHDPFGQIQDPNAKPKVVKQAITNSNIPSRGPVKKTSFDSIIKRIRINTIMPAEDRFLIGNRSFRKGDRFPIAFRGSAIQVRVIDVTANNIEFENLESGETASLQLNLLPPGMTPGNDGITAPGVISDDASSPLELDGE